jgi:4-hydroxy-tetrahydrodipicolinate reductase
MIRVGVVGAAGRMGAAVCDAVDGRRRDGTAGPVDVGDPLSLVDDCDVVVDFTAPDVVMGLWSTCIPRGVHVVVGTSGFDNERLHRCELNFAG